MADNDLKVIVKDRKTGFDLEELINKGDEKDNRFYFELGLKCAMQLRNVV